MENKIFNNKELLQAIKDIKNGKEDAFETVYNITYKKVYFFVLSILKRENIVDDVVQNIYISVYKNIHSLKDDKLFIAWLNKIAYHESIKELKRLSKIPIDTIDIDIDEKLIDNNGPLEEYLKNENNKEVMKSILELDEKYRSVILLKYFYNYKVNEIAEIVECAEGTVKSRLHTAKGLLKNKLNKSYSKITLSILFGLIISGTFKKSTYAATVSEAMFSGLFKKGVETYIIGGIAVGTALTTGIVINNTYYNSQEENINIAIDNIDKTAPSIIRYENNREEIDIYISDDISGVNYEEIKNELAKIENINVLEIDEKSGKISLITNIDSFDIKLIDNAGNFNIYNIRSENL